MGTVISGQTRKWQKKEENDVQTKSGVGFDTLMSFQVKPLIAGKYRIQWNVEAARAAGTPVTVYPKIRVNVDGVNRFLSTYNPPLEEYQSDSGWDIMDFASGATPLITVEGQRFNGVGAQPVEFKRIKLSIELMEE